MVQIGVQRTVLQLHTRISSLLSTLLLQIHLSPSNKPISSFVLKGLLQSFYYQTQQATAEEFKLLLHQWLQQRKGTLQGWQRAELQSDPDREFFYEQILQMPLDEKSLGMVIQVMNSLLCQQLTGISPDLLMRMSELYELFDQDKGHVRTLELMFLFMALIEEKELEVKSMTVRILKQQFIQFIKVMGAYRGRILPIQFKSFFIRKMISTPRIIQIFNTLVNILRILGRSQAEIKTFENALQTLKDPYKEKLFEENFDLFLVHADSKIVYSELACIYGFQYLQEKMVTQGDIKKVMRKFDSELNRLFLGFIDIHHKQLKSSSRQKRESPALYKRPIQRPITSGSGKSKSPLKTPTKKYRKEIKENSFTRARRIDDFEEVLRRLAVVRRTKKSEIFR